MKLDVLPNRAAYHWPRRIFHMASGLGIVALSFLFTEKKEFILVLLAGGILEWGFEMLRLRWAPLNEWVARNFKWLMREGEAQRLSGIPYYSVGVIFSFMVFPRPIAILAVLYLAFGDPLASVGGRYFRERQDVIPLLPDRSLQGTLVGASVCMLITLGASFWLFPSANLGVGERLVLAFVGGACAAIGELVPLRTDDNLSLPLVAGSLLWLYASFVGLVPGLIRY